MSDTTTKTPEEIRTGLAMHTGTSQYYRHWLPGALFTDGVAYLQEAAGCYWLIDAIVSHLGEINRLAKQDEMVAGLHLWTLTMATDARPLYRGDDPASDPIDAKLEMQIDTNTPVLIRQDIGYSNFPLTDGIKLYVSRVEGMADKPWLIYLPSEY